MSPSGPYFSPEALRFVRTLQRNNRREWFLPRKPQFEELIKEPMHRVIERLNEGFAEFAPIYVTPPHRAMLRIYRDTRFSHDKRPYKDHVAAAFRLPGKKNTTCATFYFHFTAKELLIFGGIYTPPAEELAALRALLSEQHEEFRRLAAARNLRKLMGEMIGDRLTRLPKGFACEHPAADLLRYKWIGFETTLPAATITSPKLAEEIGSRFRAVAPVIEFLNQPFKTAPKRKAMPFMAF